MAKIYSYKLFELESSFNEHCQCLETKPPTKTTLCINDFNDSTATTFHTTTSSDRVCLSLNRPRLLSLIIDQSGSQTWNDANKDRIEFYEKLLGRTPGNLGTLVGDVSHFIQQYTSTPHYYSSSRWSPYINAKTIFCSKPQCRVQ